MPLTNGRASSVITFQHMVDLPTSPASPTPSGTLVRSDPIRESFYRPLELAEAWSNSLFWVVAVLSILALAVEQQSSPRLYAFLQGAFIIGVLVLFVLGLAVRLYWTPRAEDKRRQGLLSDSFGVPITHEHVVGYYNNDQTYPLTRLGASLLENSLFSKRIVLEMAHGERWRVGVYAVVWLVAVVYRATDLALVAAMAQAVYSEQLISRWVRLEWLRSRFERVYDRLYQLFLTATDYDREECHIHILEAFGEYETSKGYSGIILSKRVFNRLNHDLSAEWESIRKDLQL